MDCMHSRSLLHVRLLGITVSHALVANASVESSAAIADETNALLECPFWIQIDKAVVVTARNKIRIIFTNENKKALCRIYTRLFIHLLSTRLDPYPPAACPVGRLREHAPRSLIAPIHLWTGRWGQGVESGRRLARSSPDEH